MKLKTKFQDEDFDLGEVVDGVIVECLGKHEEELRVIATAAKGGQHTFYYSSIKKFMGDWEDAPEEPKGYWTVDCGTAIKYTWFGLEHDRAAEAVGLKFDTEEECKRAIEKLKAWKRLKDKGFRFHDWKETTTYCLPYDWNESIKLHEIDKDLDLLFGGEV